MDTYPSPPKLTKEQIDQATDCSLFPEDGKGYKSWEDKEAARFVDW